MSCKKAGTLISKGEISDVLDGYDTSDLVVATLGSHSALQILRGAKEEGFKTLVIANSFQMGVYKRFGAADKYLEIERYKSLLDEKFQEKLIKKNVVLIPHGSFVEYVGAKNIQEQLRVPVFGNREVLSWEASRDKQRELMEEAEIDMPLKFSDPKNIDRLVMVKFPGAKGGKGYFLAKNAEEFNEKIKGVKDGLETYSIQEYVIGTLMYPHYFYSPILDRIELLSMDIRHESNIDGLTRIPERILKGYLVDPSYVVTGNIPMVARESLLPKIFGMGDSLVSKSRELFSPGMVGPFCIESVCTSDLRIVAFEYSARIVAGTNLYPEGGVYAKTLWNESMSTGRRIAREIKLALQKDRLKDVFY
ncbi:MAG: formate--phosphoribosylaminoimidazolecarboxamide ligase [Candidatus Altiarchaeota archaeon]